MLLNQESTDKGDQGKGTLCQWMTMDWSGVGRWTGTHTERQAELGHGTVVERRH